MENSKGAVEEIILDAAISKAIEDNRELLKPSMQHFIGGGKVNGQFDLAIKKLMRWVEGKTIEAANQYVQQSAIAFHHWEGHDSYYFDTRKKAYFSKRQEGLADDKIDYITPEDYFEIFLSTNTQQK